MRVLQKCVGLLAFVLAPTDRVYSQEASAGERLDPSAFGPTVIETMSDALARDAALAGSVLAPWDGERGAWVVPSPGETAAPHSGTRQAVNRGGDARMGIGFPAPANVHGAYVAAHGAPGTWPKGLLVRGYRDGASVAQTPWFTELDLQPRWLPMEFAAVDRLEFIARPCRLPGGTYTLDDLAFTLSSDGGGSPTVITFEDIAPKTVLSGTTHAGLTWEFGSGDFGPANAIPRAAPPPGYIEGDGSPATGGAASPRTARLPELESSFQGVIRGDAGSFSFPPDTMGAVGPNHYVVTVNRNFAVYDKTSGAELVNVRLGTFLPGSNGDPRVLFDQHAGRWVVIVSDFDTRLYLAVSLTSDPMGEWFKTSFIASQGTDAGSFPDYPTLGVDVRGIYTAAYMYPGTMTLFVIDKVPLLNSPPSLPVVTAFRGLGYEGAIQPAHTYGDPGREYLLSRQSANSLRVRAVLPPLASPTLTFVASIPIPGHANPPTVPALGSTTPLDSVGPRLMMAAYRDGYLWTTHTVGVSGRAACRWYQLDPIAHLCVQSGTVADPVLHYFFPSIMVNRNGHLVRQRYEVLVRVARRCRLS